MPAKFKFCPKCGSIDIVLTEGRDCYFCMDCAYRGCVLQGDPDFIEAYRQGFPEVVVPKISKKKSAPIKKF